MLGKIRSYHDFVAVYRSGEALWRNRRLSEFRKENPDLYEQYIHQLKNDGTKNRIMGYSDFFNG